MQNVKILNRVWSLLLALVITSSIVVACNNEAEKSTETITDTSAVKESVTTDTLPPIDTSATTRPDGKPTGGGQ